MTATVGTSSRLSGGSFSPLAQPIFAVLWAATVLGNVGSFMRDVASAWLATDLSSSPIAVAAIQAAATLPVFLLAIPAGVLTDILDRRRFLIGIQVGLGMVSGTLTLLAWHDGLTIELLIGLVFLGGVGTAMMGPSWQSIVPELVPRNELRKAVALNVMGVNIARSIGPALGGLLLSVFGAAATYALDMLSYLVVIAALIWWRRPAQKEDLLRENFLSAFRAGLRYTRAHSRLHIVLFRAGCYFLFGSSVWALLPLVAKQLLQGGSGLYGVLLGAVGVGAVAGALLLPRVQRHVSADGLLLGSAMVAAVVMACLSASPPTAIAIVLLLALGSAWITALTILSGTAQAILPGWVRGRALAVYQMVFNGAMAAGSLAWGLAAQHLGLQTSLLIAASTSLVAAWLMHRIKLPVGDVDLMPAMRWPDPQMAAHVEQDRGPVMVQITYQVAASNRRAFLKAIYAFSEERLRDGAFNWGIMEDAAVPGAFTEWFLVESWAEHLRQHKRIHNADADIQRAVMQFHEGTAPVIRHLIASPRPH